MGARSFIGAGSVYINRKVGGVAAGMNGPYLADKFEIKPAVDVKQAVSKDRYNYGAVIETVNIPKPNEFTLDLSEIVGDVLVTQFMGSAAALNQTSGTLTASPVVIKKGSWVAIGKKNLHGTITVKDATDATTYTLGTDYELNMDLGWIRVLSGSAIADAATLHISGAYYAATGSVISGGVVSEVRAEIWFNGINLADGQQCTVQVFEAVVAADSAFDFLANDFGKVTLKGQLKVPTGQLAPFLVTMQDPVATS